MSKPTSLEGLNVRLEELERRVTVLERGRKAESAEPAPELATPSPIYAIAEPQRSSGFFSVMGTAMLGIAGAYLLRAATESHVLAEVVLAPLAILYALAWLAAAARSAGPLPRVTYACTSMLIIAPMLWELTMRFNVLPAWADALSLLAMTAVAYSLGRSAESTVVVRIANVTVAVLTLVLAIGTHSNLPFLAVLLVLLTLSAIPAVQSRLGTASGLLALATDLGVWLLIYIYRSAHPDYPELTAAWLVAPGFALFAIAAAKAAITSCARQKRLSRFDIVQTVIAFLLACSGWLYFGPPARLPILGIVCLLLAAAVYVALFTVLRHDEDSHNRTVFATWSAVLVLAGSFLCIPEHWRAEWLGLGAVAAIAGAIRANHFFLVVHGNLFLLASAIASGLGICAWQELAATPGGPPSFAIFFTLGCALTCYVILRRKETTISAAASYLSVALAAVTIAALLAHAVIGLAELRFTPGPPHLAVIRSLTLCTLALLLAICGAVLRHRVLTHIAYAAVVLEALKLLAEDLRHGQLAYIAASVCLFAITLIALPRVARKAELQN